jgi:HD-like signal output (HDOD) protein
MDFVSIVSDINELPPLSDITHQVQTLYNEGSENVNILQLVRVIESDAALSANILHMVNAPYYGFSRKIASVSQALTLLGTDTIYGLVLNFVINNSVKANMRPYGLSNSQFNDICHLQSALMLQWYSKIDLRHAQFLTPLALIMESGKLVVAREVVRYGNIKEFAAGIQEAEDTTSYEHQLFGSSSYFVSGLLFEHWNMEPLYVEILKGLDYERNKSFTPKTDAFIESLDVVRSAVNVKDIFTTDSLKKASELLEEMGFYVDDFLKVAKRIKEKYEKNTR